MNNRQVHIRQKRGFTLVEILVSLVIGSMVLIAILTVHRRIQKAAIALESHLDKARVSGEILQRIAEDLDKVIAAGQDIKISIDNNFNGQHRLGRLQITQKVADVNGEDETFRQVVWQGAYDMQSDTGGFVLYRSHSGIVPEDTLLEQARSRSERELFIPICQGLTLFRVTALQDDSRLEKWENDNLPPGIEIAICFTEPYETAPGVWEFAEEDVTSRVIAVDRTRMIQFNLVEEGEPEYPWLEVNEPNQEPNDANQVITDPNLDPNKIPEG